jgi:hypothetical protein
MKCITCIFLSFILPPTTLLLECCLGGLNKADGFLSPGTRIIFTCATFCNSQSNLYLLSDRMESLICPLQQSLVIREYISFRVLPGYHVPWDAPMYSAGRGVLMQWCDTLWHPASPETGLAGLSKIPTRPVWMNARCRWMPGHCEVNGSVDTRMGNHLSRVEPKRKIHHGRRV